MSLLWHSPRVTEDELVERLRLAFDRPSADVTVGIGDDAAVLAPSGEACVLSVDAAFEGVHFRRAWASLPELGRRSFVAAMSDLAAMGARPRAALVALALPPGFSNDDVESLARGLAAAADEAGAPIVGGNLTRATELSITTTVVGSAPGRTLTRRGALPGEAVWVTGTLGAAALGLVALERERADDTQFAPYVRRWRAPHARLTVGQRLVDLASAAIDVSDGLVIDLGRLARSSGVGVRLETELLALEPGFVQACAALDVDPLDLALGGGEDYELVFAAPVGSAVAAIATRIGAVVEGEGVEVALPDGTPVSLTKIGHDHFGR